MIDWNRVAELRDEIGAEDFSEVAEIFLEEIAETLHQLMADPAATRASDFHFLRGSAVNLGFQDFAARALEAERICDRGGRADLDTLSQAFDAAKTELAKAHPELRIEAA